jgi:hypothetical protein
MFSFTFFSNHLTLTVVIFYIISSASCVFHALVLYLKQEKTKTTRPSIKNNIVSTKSNNENHDFINLLVQVGFIFKEKSLIGCSWIFSWSYIHQCLMKTIEWLSEYKCVTFLNLKKKCLTMPWLCPWNKL